MKKHDWLTGIKAGPGSIAPGVEKPLDSEARSALVRDTFAAVSMVGFLQFRKQELALGVRVTEDDRKAYFKFLEDSFRPEFDAMAANASDARLLEVLQWWIKEGKANGLTEWQQEQGRVGREL